MSSRSPNTSPLLPFRALFPPRNYATRFQHVLEQMPSAALVVSPRTGQFITINGRATVLTGWTREELIAQSLAEVVLAPEALMQFHTLEPGNARQLQAVPLSTRAGRPILVDLRISAFEDGGDVIALALATPTDERLTLDTEKARQEHLAANLHHVLELFEAPTEDSLHAAVQRVSAMFNADAVGLYRSQDDHGSLKLECSQHVPKSIPHSLAPEETAALKSPMVWAHPQRAENPLTQAFRALGWSHVLAQPLGRTPRIMGMVFIAYQAGSPPPASASLFLEVIARQLMHLMRQIGRHARLLEAQRLAYHLTNQLAGINAQISEGVVILNSSGAIDDLNGAAAQMLGYRAEDVIGYRYDDVVVADDGLMQLIGAVLEGLLDQAEQEGQMLRRSGEGFPVSVRARPLPAPIGGCVLVLHDLSSARANQLHRENLDHLAYVGQSTASFAHEVRAPLNNISMGVQYVASRLPQTDPMQAALAKIQAEATRLSDLMNSMLAWAKPIEPKLEAQDLGALLSRLLNRWNAKLQQRNVERVLTCPADCPPVLIDGGLIERVFVNLIENALQAMPAGGHLTITLQHADRGLQGNVVEVKIADDGPGIPEEYRKRIFEPYFTTRADGTGLGLAIAKRIVTVHRGAINVESFPGTGTIFTVTLPAYVEAVPTREAAAQEHDL